MDIVIELCSTLALLHGSMTSSFAAECKRENTAHEPKNTAHEPPHVCVYCCDKRVEIAYAYFVNLGNLDIVQKRNFCSSRTP